MPVGVEQWRAAVGAMARSAAPEPRSPIGPRWNKWLKASDPAVYKGCVVLLVTIAQLVSSGLELVEEKTEEMVKEMSLLFSNRKRPGLSEVTMIVFVNQMLLMISGDVEPNPGPDILTPEDLATLVNELYGVRAKWYDLGVQLRIEKSDLDAFETQYQRNLDRCLQEMLSHWLSQTDPSWQGIVSALSSPSLSQSLLAERLEKKYCSHKREGGNGLSSAFLSVKEIRTEMDELENEFEALKDDVYESVRNQQVDIFKVKLTSFKINDKEHHMKYVKEMIADKNTITGIWIELNSYLNFFNYSLLQHILNKFKNADLQERMDRYTSALKVLFGRTRICDFVECWPIRGDKPPVDQLKKFIVRSSIMWDTCTLEDLDNLKERLASKLLLPSFILILEKASEGSLSVTFSIPTFLVSQLQADIKSKKIHEFEDMSIKTITVDGIVCFDYDFSHYIESNPMIGEASVSAAIVEQVFKSAPHNPPTTVTGLYSAYVLMRLEQHLSEHPDYSGSNIQVRTLVDLPERVLGDLQRLCSLAYEGVSQQMIVFSSLPEGVSTLGLLETVPQVYDEGEDRVSYNFLHYTVQEYLAALHLSLLQPQQLMTIIDTKCPKYVRSYYEATRYKTTFQFLAGITMLEPFPVDFLSDLLEKEAATVYRWLYESQNQSLLTSVLGSGERKLSLSHSATLTDYFAAGYCLAHSNCRWSIGFDCMSVDDVSMEFLSKGCNHQLPETGISSQLVTASFMRGSITAEGVGHFLTIPNSVLQHIKHLNLNGNNLDRRGCELLAEGVQRMPCLEELNLGFNSGIGCGGAVQLVSSLQYCSKLRELNMTRTGISDPDFQCLATYVSSTTSLEELRIGWNDISVESIDSLCKALSANSSMRRLRMSHCRLTTSHCVCLGQLLRHPIHCQIEKLDICGCSLTSDGVGEVVSGLSDNTTLRELDLWWNQIGSEGAVAVATMLKTNSSLERLNLHWCGIGSRGGVELGAALERNKTLRCLDLSWNTLGDDGVRGLCVGLGNNSSLEELKLTGDRSLGEEGALLLYQQTTEKQGMLSPRRLRIFCDKFTSVEDSQGTLHPRFRETMKERRSARSTGYGSSASHSTHGAIEEEMGTTQEASPASLPSPAPKSSTISIVKTVTETRQKPSGPFTEEVEPYTFSDIFEKAEISEIPGPAGEEVEPYTLLAAEVTSGIVKTEELAKSTSSQHSTCLLL